MFPFLGRSLRPTPLNLLYPMNIPPNRARPAPAEGATEGLAHCLSDATGEATRSCFCVRRRP